MSTWTCPKCETNNPAENEHCEVCDSHRSFVPLVVALPTLLSSHSAERSSATRPSVLRNWFPIWLLLVGVVFSLLLIAGVFPKASSTTILQTTIPTLANKVDSMTTQTAQLRKDRTATMQAAQQSLATSTAVAEAHSSGTATATARLSQPAKGQVTSAGLRVRLGPGTEYPPKSILQEGSKVSIIGWADDSQGVRWWKIGFPPGWISSAYIGDIDCITCVPELNRPPIP